MTSRGGDGSGSGSPTVTAPPSISLPKGGGAIRGLGEKLGANPATGSAKATIPIATSPGRHGFGPRLALTYDSARGATAFGLGWSLDLPAIARRTDRGVPTYRDSENSDVFVLAGAEDLVPALVQTAAGAWVREQLPQRVVDGVTYDIRRYIPRIEGVFARIERWTSRSDRADDFWRTITADDVTTWYGRTRESRVADPEDPTRIFRWLICETHDDQGHVAVYRYKAEDGTGIDSTVSHELNRNDAARHGERHLKRVRYGNARPFLPVLEPGAPWPEPPGTAADDASRHWLFEVVLDYGDHPGDAPRPLESTDWAPRGDPFSSYRAGFELRTYRRCQRVLMFHHFPDEPAVAAGCLVRSTAFDYSLRGEGPAYSVLTRVTQWSHRRSGIGYDRRCLPPLEFAYSEAVVDPTVRELDPDSLEGLPEGVDGARYRLVDLDGEGRAGILTEQSGGWAYKRNLSTAGVARFGGPERINPLPSPPQLAGRQLLDLAGNGRLDVASFTDPAPGFFARRSGGWEPLVAFDSLPTIDWADPNLRLVDLTGDGRADVLITEDDVLRWYPSLGEAGFGAAEATPQALDEERGPRLVFADGTGTVYLADMSGDGLSDLVRIRNGSVAYWPSLGHGRFGAKVTMDDAPWLDAPDRFDERRVRLADIDGSGTVDLIYLGDRGVDLYFNRSGNGWSAARRLEHVPRIDDVAAVEAADLLGTGTTCLVWSSALAPDASRPLRYIDLMGGRKPHLLTRTTNNLGLQTELEYAASTEFSLADRLAGRPWAFPPAFPVHVVRRVTVRDAWRGTSFSSTYAYHQGCFDPVEREFRGFGGVEQRDVEDFAAFAGANAGSDSVTTDTASYQAPVETVSWFDTGMRTPSADEYLAGVGLGGFREPAPDDDVATADLDAGEWREAGRATKGRLLRSEVYELDAQGRRVRLLSAGRHTAHVRRLQPRAGNPHAVFLVLESEAVGVEYDLDLRPGGTAADPRVTHSLTLAADEYGHPLETVGVTYGRRGAAAADGLDPAQLATVRALQGDAHLRYTATRFTNDVSAPDARRLRAPFEVRTYELTGIRPTAPDGAFTLAELRGLDPSGLAEIPHHQRASAAVRRKRLVEHTRTRYGRDDLQGPLPLGQQQRLGLVHQTCTLALTDAQLDAVIEARLADVVDGSRTAREALRDRATSGYLSGAELAAAFAPLVPAAETAGQYWQPSGTASFPTDAADHFFLPTRYTDAFGASSTVAWDRYDLYARRSTDAVGNSSSVEAFDFRVLSPSMHRDVNGNLREVAFDVLGLVVAAAIRGKASEGDTLAGFDAALTDPDPTTVAVFCSGPAFDEATARVWLGGATTRFVYHLGEAAAGWAARPAASCRIAREVHADPATPLQVSLECSDGSARSLMVKHRAEPAQPGGAARWIVGGRTVVNNKGKPVKRYEPYFSDAFGCETVAAAGATALMFYDASGRLVRTEMPDGTVTRTDRTPWAMVVHDADDTVLEPGNAWYAAASAAGAPAELRRAARLAAAQSGSPSVTLLDALGRSVAAIARNLYEDGTGVRHDGVLFSYSRLDFEGNTLWARDPTGKLTTQHVRPAMPAGRPSDVTTGFVTGHDIAGRLLYEHNVDAGERWTLPDVGGKPLAAWTVNDRRDDTGGLAEERRVLFFEYDAARRPTRGWLTVNGGAPRLVERFVYGETLADAQARNLRAQLHRHEEASGRLQNERFDVDGNLVEVSRRLVADHRAPMIDWQADPETVLEAERFVQLTEFDAVGRPARIYPWHRGTGSRVAVIEPHYDERGQLAREDVSLRATKTAGGHISDPAFPRVAAIAEIRRNARGQTELMRLGNGTVTRYDLDPNSFRVRQLRTTRPGFDPPFPNDAGALRDARVLQNLHFTYDAAGNLSATRDDACEPVFFANQLVEPVSRYLYDGVYRLVEAGGRESSLPSAPEAVTFPVTAKTLRNYTRRFAYDGVGNITEIVHVAAGGSWTRHFEHVPASNRLRRSWDGNAVVNAVVYAHDRHGNVLNVANVPESRQIRWSDRDSIRALDLGGGGWAWYTHHGGGQRARRVITVNRDGPKRYERIQLDGVDVYRRYAAGRVVEETESLHLFADDARVLLVDDVLATEQARLSPGPHLRYQYADQVGSTTLEADERARIIGYEEFHPYGTTAYRARSDAVEAPARRYRYTGAERDEESGFDDHGARNYAPWLGRWLSCDPAGDGDGPNRYAYCRGSPVLHTDPSGHQTGLLGLSGPYQNLATQQNWTREHFIPGRQFYWMLAQAFGRDAADQVWGRLYANADATQLVNTVADVKTNGAAATATLPEVIGDNTKRGLTAMLRADTKAGRTTDVTNLYLLNRRNFVGSLLHGGFTPDEGTMKAYHKGVVAESRTLFVNEGLLDAQQTKGTPIPPQTAGLINPKTPPQQPPAAGPVPVVHFEKPASGTPPPSAPASPAPSAPAEAPAPAAAPAAPASSGLRGYARGFGNALGTGLVTVGLPIAVGYVAQLPFESEGAKRTASELGAGLTSTGIEWVGLVGAPVAATGLRVAATTVATSGGAALGSAFGASTLSGIAAAGSGAVAAAGAAVAAAGAAGYGIGTVANKYFLQAQIDKLQLGSGAVGDWWYQHVLK